MSNEAFNNFLSNKGYGPIMKDFQHASKLYVDSLYARAPKFGFLYFIEFDINEAAISDTAWALNDRLDVGLLAKKSDLPKFNVGFETVNQYNRKTNVHTKLTYNPISIELHDDNSDITHNLWVNYYKNYFNDSNQDEVAFKDTKYKTNDYIYGRYNNGITVPFLNAINIYVLHQQNFTKYTLVNPKITDWQHDSVNQSEGNKLLQNKFTVVYENVIYNSGKIIANQEPIGWSAVYYDKDSSPNTVAGNKSNDVTYGPNGTSSFDKPGKERIFGSTRPQSPSMLQQLGTILAKNYINQNGLSRQKSVGYNIAGSVMGQLGSGPGKYASPPDTQDQPGVFTLPCGVGINIFKGLNTTVDGKVRANPAAILFPPKK